MKYSTIAAAFALVASTAFASAAETKLSVNFCTGGQGGPYDITGNLIATYLKGSRNIEVKVINTKGSWDNIDRATNTSIPVEESCQVFLTQPDGPVQLKRTNPAAATKIRSIGSGPVEYLHALCNKDSGITDIEDLAGDNKRSIILGARGSGAWLVWQNFIAEDAKYGEVQTLTDWDSGALSAVNEGEATCMLVPAALGNALVRKADANYPNVELAEATDWDFNDATTFDGKQKLYTFTKIPSGTYNEHLQGWFSGRETIAWKSQVMVNKEVFADHEQAYNELIDAVAKSRPAVEEKFGKLN